MRNVAIIGGGQGGLQLGLGLLKNRYTVSLVTDRSEQDLEEGSILSSQAMFSDALQLERDLGIDFWQSECPQNSTVNFTLSKPGISEIWVRWKGFVSRSFQSVDQRLKFSRWLTEFRKLGGAVHIKTATLNELEEIANSHDLTIVASGKGELSKIFLRDSNRSIFTSPARVLACMYVTGMEPASNPGVRPNIVPGIGEYFTLPGLSKNGPCEMMLFEGIPGEAFDCWGNIKMAEGYLDVAVRLLKKFVPWEAERCKNISLTDSKAVLRGAYTPEVRHPVYRLSSGKSVLGMADVVVLNDPIAGQGANNACKCADVYLRSILLKRDEEFDSEWMLNTFDRFWENARWSTALSNLLLLPPEPHVIQLFETAKDMQNLSNRIAEGFNRPQYLFPWILDANKTKEVILKYKSGARVEID